MVGGRTPDVPSKGFFLKIIWSSFYPRKKATEKHRKSFDPTVDQVLKIKIKKLKDHKNGTSGEAARGSLHSGSERAQLSEGVMDVLNST